ncbi:MAG TPA: hypothetical protein VF549_08075 [Solirubrobacteraceae bacterium]|jgi:hypothetical protein
MTVQTEIDAKARDFGLGAPSTSRPNERPFAQRTPAPRNHGFWEAFERGWVYWTPNAGAHQIWGTIFATWAREGWEQGPLGFPVSDELVSPTNPADRYQLFENGALYWHAARNLAERQDTTRRRGSFRVTLNGFRCLRPTWDDALQRDGVDDELFVRSEAQVFDGANRRLGGPLRTTSTVMGDAHNRPERIRAGSGSNIFGGNGGFREGDQFPASNPVVRSGPPAPGPPAPPMILFDGQLIEGETSVLVAPTLWEFDSGSAPAAQPEETGTIAFIDPPPILAFLRLLRAHTLPSPGDGTGALQATLTNGDAAWGPTAGAFTDPTQVPGFAAVRVHKNLFGDPGDRPIGMADTGEFYTFNPQVLALTFNLAERLTASQPPLPFAPAGARPNGIVGLRYTDNERLRGDYVMFLQVERTA